MKATFFNKYESSLAFSFIKTNPIHSKDLYEKYLEKYPTDYYVYYYYIYVLIVLKEIDKAKDVLEKFVSLFNNDTNIFNEPEKVKRFHRDVVLIKFHILAYENKYKELYDLYMETEQEINKFDSVIFYCKKQMGLLENVSRENYKYLFRQICEYKEDDFLYHIKKHTFDYNPEFANASSLVFAQDFPLEKVIDEIKKYIPSEKGLYTGYYEDKYTFKYDGCGRHDYKLTDYFRVVCLHDSCDFITMYPEYGCENLPFIDLNYLAKDKPKVKTMSQIEKFNRRYR